MKIERIKHDKLCVHTVRVVSKVRESHWESVYIAQPISVLLRNGI